ncbi:MAG: hypothetical protein M3Q75_06925, partial [Gemmatimonadota bacterium]|nr:hypothetical protein [Gemmatimonadota bacterium]
MRRSRRLAAISRLALATLATIAIATPASAQFGGLKKKIKPAAAQPANNTEGAAPEDQGGMIVLTKDVVNQLITGLKAGKVERQAASEADTPYGLHNRAETAYAEAKVKCEAAQQGFYHRMGGNKKIADKYDGLIEKMVAAQNALDAELTAVYQDSAAAMQDPSCIVKEPKQAGGDYHQAQREVDARAEKLEAEASGFSRSELAIVKERADAILRNVAPPGGASPAEKSAVAARSAELKPLLGIRDQPVATAAKPKPAPAPASAAAGHPQMSAAASSMGDCVGKNAMKHEARLEALGERAEAAEAAGDMPKLMAIADTLQ